MLAFQVDQAVLEIDPLPFQAQQLAFAHPGMQGQRDQVRQMRRAGSELPRRSHQGRGLRVGEPTHPPFRFALLAALHRVVERIPPFPIGVVDGPRQQADFLVDRAGRRAGQLCAVRADLWHVGAGRLAKLGEIQGRGAVMRRRDRWWLLLMLAASLAVNIVLVVVFV